ncbi:MAG: hypothetical protein OEY86_00870 [Nitrospira sp.]|nr:hypothetical protein [Nitrospira sp.]
MYDSKWEWVDTVFGVIAGVMASVISMLGWLAPKFAKIEAEADALRNDMNVKVEAVHIRITGNAQEITGLRAHREDDQRRLESIDKKLDKILDRIPRDPWNEKER